MAKDGVFPKVFARTSRRDTPVFALVFGSALVTILVVLNAGDTSVRVFTFMVLLATSACLVMYLVCCLALLRLQWLGRLGAARRGTAGLAAVGLIGTALLALGHRRRRARGLAVGPGPVRHGRAGVLADAAPGVRPCVPDALLLADPALRAGC